MRICGWGEGSRCSERVLVAESLGPASGGGGEGPTIVAEGGSREAGQQMLGTQGCSWLPQVYSVLGI